MFLSTFRSLAIFICIAPFLTSCNSYRDPICCNQSSTAPSNFWVPKCSYEPCPCDNQNDDELSLSILQKPQVILADLINVGLHNNPSTKITWANARAAAYGVGVAESALYPEINFQEELVHTKTKLDNMLPDVFLAPGATLPDQVYTGFVGTINQSFTTLSVSYLLLDFGGRGATIQAARQAMYGFNWHHNRQIQNVIFSVLQSYYTYEGLKALVVSRQADLKNAQKNYEAANAQFQAGIKNKLDVLQAQSDLVNIELSIVELEGQRAVAHGNLANALGLDADAEFNVPDFPTDAELDRLSFNVEHLVDIAMEERPDLAAAYAEHERLKEEVVIARSAGLPTLTANAYALETAIFPNGNFNNHTFSGSISLNVPLFSGFYYVDQVKQAQERVRAACANIQLKKNAVSLDVVTSYADLLTAIESFRFSQEFLKYSQEAYDAALATYQAGISTILDVLTAQRNLALAKAQKIRTRTSWAIALANVSYSTGVLGINKEITLCK